MKISGKDKTRLVAAVNDAQKCFVVMGILDSVIKANSTRSVVRSRLKYYLTGKATPRSDNKRRLICLFVLDRKLHMSVVQSGTMEEFLNEWKIIVSDESFIDKDAVLKRKREINKSYEDRLYFNLNSK